MSCALVEVLAHAASLEASTETLTMESIRLLAGRIRSLVESALVGASAAPGSLSPPSNEVEKAEVPPAPSLRPLSMTPEAVRARRRRRSAAGRPATDPLQLALPMDGGRDRGRDRSRPVADRPESAELSQRTVVATAVATGFPLSLSDPDLNTSSKRERETAVATGRPAGRPTDRPSRPTGVAQPELELRPDSPLDEDLTAIFDKAVEARGVELPPANVVWLKFLTKHTRFHRVEDLHGAWRRWALCERPAPSEPPPSSRRVVSGTREEDAAAEDRRQADELAARERRAALLEREQRRLEAEAMEWSTPRHRASSPGLAAAAGSAPSPEPRSASA